MSETEAPRDDWTGPIPENATIDELRQLEFELDNRAYSAKVVFKVHSTLLELVQEKLTAAGEVPISQLRFKAETP